MLEPVGAKITNVQFGRKFLCPTPERPYFATLNNSGKDRQEVIARLKNIYVRRGRKNIFRSNY